VRRILLAIAAAGLLLAGAGPGHAQTTTQATTQTRARATTQANQTTHHGTAKKHAPEKHRVVHHVPVVAPRHVGPPRHPVPATRTAALKVRLARRPPPAAVVPLPPPRPQAAPPGPPGPPDVGSVTGLPLPRYASLKTDDVNMRVGPAERYPIAWTYKRRELPVKIEGEFDVWRKVEDMDGIQGWMHQATLTGRRTFVITGTQNQVMRTEANETADPVAVLKPGVVGRIRSCEAGHDWCQVQVQDYRGWLKRSDFWGAGPEEAIAPG
jgi:SH3-like domain-containing protein